MSAVPFLPPASVGRFALRFGAFAALLLGACEAARGTALVREFVSGALVSPVARLLDAFSPDERVDAVGASLVSASAQLNVVRGCDGLEAVILYAAAVLAWPGTPARRVAALAVGVAAIHGSNLLRLVASWLVVRYAPDSFAWVHGVVAPLALVLGAALLFSGYVTWSTRTGGTHGRRA